MVQQDTKASQYVRVDLVVSGERAAVNGAVSSLVFIALLRVSVPPW